MKEKGNNCTEKNSSDCDGDDNFVEGKLVIDMDAGAGPPDVATTTSADPAPKISAGEYQKKSAAVSGSAAKQPAVKRKVSSGARAATATSDVNNRQSSPDPQHSDNNSNSDSQNLRLKIKRKKMATRQTAVRQEAANVDSNLQKCDSAQGSSSSVSCGATVSDEKLERRDVGTWVRTIGNATDAECFGPCEPGTAVTLEGIVWHETTGGILVVNVTWRGKSYVGTLLDCTKSDWAAPRFCESPNNDLDGSKTPAKGRGLKRCAGSSASLNNNRSNANSSGPSSSDVQNGQQKSQNNKQYESVALNGLSDNSPADTVAPPTGSDASSSTTTVKSELILEPSSPLLFECPLNGCEKKYGQLTALKYHQNSSHFSLARNKPVAVRTPAESSTIPPKDDVSVDTNKLSEAEHESLENLFKVVDQHQTSSSSNSKTPPNLIADGNNRGGGSPSYYSDISDDEEAPKLERHSSPAKCTIEDKQQPAKTLSPAPLAVPNTMMSTTLETIRAVPPELSLPKTLDLKGHAVKMETGNLIGNSSKKGSALPVAKQIALKQELCTSPKPPEKKPKVSSSQSIAPVPYPYATFPLQSNGHPTHLPMNRGSVSLAFETAAPLLYGGPPMFAFPVGPPSSTAGLVNPSSMYFGMPLQQQPQLSNATSHKIHELTETAGKLSAPSNASNVITGENKNQQTEAKVRRDEPSSDTSRSPPIQRHLHTHHHTHSYPIISSDYAALLASHNQQAAATMVGAFPPFARK